MHGGNGGNKRLLEASSVVERRRREGRGKGFFRGEEAVFEPRR